MSLSWFKGRVLNLTVRHLMFNQLQHVVTRISPEFTPYSSPPYSLVFTWIFIPIHSPKPQIRISHICERRSASSKPKRLRKTTDGQVGSPYPQGLKGGLAASETCSFKHFHSNYEPYSNLWQRIQRDGEQNCCGKGRPDKLLRALGQNSAYPRQQPSINAMFY